MTKYVVDDGHHFDWFNVGREHWADNEDAIVAAAQKMEWHSIPCDLPMAQGLAIKAAIHELQLPKVSAVAESSDLAPYALLGIQCEYKNAHVRVYLVDEGSQVLPLFADVWH